jgi:hypothetical protein
MTGDIGRENTMRLITRSVVVLGIIGTMAFASAAPSLAKGVYFEGPSFGLEVGRPPYRERYYRGNRDYNYYDSRERLRGGCRIVTIDRDDGSIRKSGPATDERHSVMFRRRTALN